MAIRPYFFDPDASGFSPRSLFHTFRLGIPALILLLSCLLWSHLNWLKLDTFWGDPSHCLFVIYRVAMGDQPYSEVMWPYPPLGLWVMQWAFQSLGATYWSAQITFIALSTALVFLVWAIARTLMPEALALSTAIAFGLVGASYKGGPALFSLNVYTPAILTGTLGVLLAVWGSIVYLRTSPASIPAVLLLTGGAIIALLSKAECGFGSLVCIGYVMAYEAIAPFRKPGWFRPAMLPLFVLGPVILVYLWVGKQVGWGPLQAGLSGYNISHDACPWWPTGIGLVAIAASAGSVWGIAAVLSLCKYRLLRQLHGKRYQYFLGGGLLSVWLWGLYLFLWKEDILQATNLSHAGPLGLVKYALSSTSVFLSLQWFMLGVLGLCLGQWIRGHRRAPAPLIPFASILGLLVVVAMAQSLRSLFGHLISPFPMVAYASYPLLFIVLSFALWRYLAWICLSAVEPDRQRRRAAQFALLVTSLGLLAYGGLRLADRAMDLGHPFALQTQAGTVRLANQASLDLYEFVQRNIGPEDQLSDLSYGGGINFALHRSSPLFSTMFSWFSPSADILNLDLQKIQTHPPKLVILGENTGAYGLKIRCALPHIVWIPSQSRVNQSFPALTYIQTHYQPIYTTGDRTVYQRLSPSPS
ncbi:hypothetical protein [Lyngbya confervoides]|uniref:Glycosyltransferase RgtA/B/C/D-like domain-containing protein n=1 Tax=Lyngbya confervoides BDU141951 TaxID=1574623 RepID=A0ABD4T422_9CYAN|nr:hypothetical protein [Lyngbya confervoides]MCM1983228.1 hypothetical protein [Lyngbya confervoides BDU141951]